MRDLSFHTLLQHHSISFQERMPVPNSLTIGGASYSGSPAAENSASMHARASATLELEGRVPRGLPKKNTFLKCSPKPNEPAVGMHRCHFQRRPRSAGGEDTYHNRARFVGGPGTQAEETRTR